MSLSSLNPIDRERSDSGADRCILSVLIPAYEHPVGVVRILDCLYVTRVSGIECIVSDDSLSDAVLNAVKSHPFFLTGDITYIRNKPSLGAVLNWNSLLKSARGEYVLLMHHDEAPAKLGFFDVLLNEIRTSEFPDVMVFECLVFMQRLGRFRPNQPRWLRASILRWAPSLLLLHNVIGAPSMLVLKRRCCPLFDAQLKWLVDVDWMIRIFSNPELRWSVSRVLPVTSLHNTAVSVTESIKFEVNQLRQQEFLLLADRLGDQAFVSRLGRQSFFGKFMWRTERIFWITFQVLLLPFSMLKSQAMPNWFMQNQNRD